VAIIYISILFSQIWQYSKYKSKIFFKKMSWRIFRKNRELVTKLFFPKYFWLNGENCPLKKITAEQ
jgi:hypothetical protein